jgi:hypothetical protein
MDLDSRGWLYPEISCGGKTADKDEESSMKTKSKEKTEKKRLFIRIPG